MNNKDSKTYKDMYHFTDRYFPAKKEDVPSLDVPPRINDTIKKNPYRSNVEIEGNEIVYEPDLTALYKARGKRHSKGGMDVYLKPNSFVFSDNKGVALNQHDCDMLELESGGYAHRNKKYTPAEVLKKNVDTKHYNKLVNNLQDVKTDDLAKKSSAMMLEKYITTLGNIAYAQEKKKGFPDGLPDFSQGTAPVYDTDLKAELMEQKQFAKYGGRVNPYLPQAQWGIANFLSAAKPVGHGTNRRPKTPGAYYDPITQLWYTDKSQVPVVSNPNPFGMTGPQTTTFGRGTGVPTPSSGHFYAPAQKATTLGFKDESGIKPNTESGVAPKPEIPFKIPIPNFPDIYPPETPDTPSTTAQTTIRRGEVTGVGQGYKQARWRFTPEQLASMGYDAFKLASAKRYMPFRSHFNPSYIEPQLLNPEQLIGDLKGAAYQQAQAANSLSPVLRNSQMNNIYGQLLNQLPGVRSQYDNANVGITNQFRGMNNQIRNNAAGINMQNDQNYYQQSVIGQQNFDNMKAFLSDRLANNIFRNVEANQDLSLKLLAQGPNPAYGFDFKTGRFTRNPQNILDLQGAPGEGLYEDILKGIQNLPDTDPKKWEIYEKILRQKNILPYLTQQTAKKGGKIKRNPYRY